MVIDGVTQPAPAPRFSATPCGMPSGPAQDGYAKEWALAWGVPAELIAHMD